MCHFYNEKQKITYDRRNENNQSRKIKTFEEKETYKFLGILEAFSLVSCLHFDAISDLRRIYDVKVLLIKMQG